MIINEEKIPLKDDITLTLRSPKPDDATAMLAFMRLVYGETTFMNRMSEELENFPAERERNYLSALETDDSAFMLCIFDGEKIVATLGVTVQNAFKTKHRATLGISVAKAYWHMGLGTTLMRKAITIAQKLGIEQLELDVVTTNARAISLYEKFGFEKTGTIPHAQKLPDGTYQDFYNMVKFL
jgi:RimJ/RimL family protein N-acetyltransferase